MIFCLGKLSVEVFVRKTYLYLAIVAVLAASVLAQSDSDYQSWMKSTPATMGSLNKNIAAKDGAATAADAQKLEATFKQVEAFWKSVVAQTVR